MSISSSPYKISNFPFLPKGWADKGMNEESKESNRISFANIFPHDKTEMIFLLCLRHKHRERWQGIPNSPQPSLLSQTFGLVVRATVSQGQGYPLKEGASSVSGQSCLSWAIPPNPARLWVSFPGWSESPSLACAPRGYGTVIQGQSVFSKAQVEL